MPRIPNAPCKNIRSLMATSLTIMFFALSGLNIEAVGAPNSKILTPAETAQRKSDYLRYQQYVRAQLSQQHQSFVAQKLKQRQQIAQNTPKSAETAPTPPKKHVPIRREDILLVMPAKGAKGDEIKESIENAQGEICGRLGAGGLSVLLVKARPGKITELQRALAANTRDFKHVDYNRKCKADFIPTTEPSFSTAWHLMRMNIVDAWDEIYKYNDFPNAVAVFDTGAQGSECFIVDQGVDCTGMKDKADDLGIDDGFLGTGLFGEEIKDQEKDIVKLGNYIKARTKGNSDNVGHGTSVGCIITGSPYNGLGAAGINPKVPVFPIKVADGPFGQPAYADDLAMIAGMCVVYSQGNDFRIINISYGPMMDPDQHQILHEFFKDFYYRKNGLVFLSAGNAGENLSMANQPYINVVSAMAHKEGMKLVKNKIWQSASGTAVDFTAPGQDIEVCNPDGTPTQFSGTSAACPIVAGVASMIWCINGKLKNTEVEKILRDSCENTDGRNAWNPQFGWGMPNAFDAVKAAEATRR